MADVIEPTPARQRPERTRPERNRMITEPDGGKAAAEDGVMQQDSLARVAFEMAKYIREAAPQGEATRLGRVNGFLDLVAKCHQAASGQRTAD